MHSPVPCPRSVARVPAALSLLLMLLLPGCDQVQDMIGEGEAKTEPAAAPAGTTSGTTTSPAQAQSTPAQPAAADPAQILSEFRSLRPDQITDSALKRVADVPEAAAQIRELDMSASKIRSGSLTLLAQFPNLQLVKVSHVKLPAGGFATFSPQSKFSEIELVNTTIDEAGIASLAAVRSLKRVNLSMSPAINSGGLTPLSQLVELNDLDLSQTRVDSSITPMLASLPLQRLNLSKTSVSDAGLPAIASIRTLRELNLSFCPITGVGFRSAFKSSQLVKLEVAETSFGEAGLLAVRGMKTLEELNVYKAQIAPLNSVRTAFSSLPKLRVLHVGANRVIDAAIAPWFGSCRNLEELNISAHQTMVTNAGLAGLVKLQKLKHLNCANTAVNEQGAAALKQKIPGLEVTVGSGQRL